MKSVREHFTATDFGSEHLNELAKKVIELFDTLDPKDQEKVLWMIQGYNLAQKEED